MLVLLIMLAFASIVVLVVNRLFPNGSEQRRRTRVTVRRNGVVTKKRRGPGPERERIWWRRPPLAALSSSKYTADGQYSSIPDWNIHIVGESYRQDALVSIVGVDPDGHRYECAAQLVLPVDMPDYPDAVAILIDGLHVGFIAADEAAAIKSELERLTGIDDGVTCKAIIRGGWDRSDEGLGMAPLGVSLSLARPLRAQ